LKNNVYGVFSDRCGGDELIALFSSIEEAEKFYEKEGWEYACSLIVYETYEDCMEDRKGLKKLDK
jgi:hypothetical protein